MLNRLLHTLYTGPDAPLPYDEALRAFDWWQAMAVCPQDVIHHAEGDVAIHTRLVVEALQGADGFQTLPADERGTLLLAALLHDIAKPATTREEDGRITARGHSGRGEVMARCLLYEAGIPFAVREAVCALIRFHQYPFYVIDRADSLFQAIRISQSARCDHLTLLAQADALGRICADQEQLLTNIALFAEFCAEVGCLTAPYTFATDHSRFQYFRARGERDPAYAAHETPDRPELILLSGLPGAGKDTYLRGNRAGVPVVSLDELRSELKVSPRDGQERVADAARTQTRAYLRRGESVIWNATNLSREMREKRLRLAEEHDARVRIIYIEAPFAVQRRQNRSRPDAVPESVLHRMLHRWEIPDLTEAHAIEWHIRDADELPAHPAQVTRAKN